MGLTSRRVRIAALILGIVVLLTGIGIAVSVRQLEPQMRDWLTGTLSRSLESDVQLGEVNLSWFPLRITGRDLTIRHHGRTDVPPLLVISSFTVNVYASELWGSTVDYVKVDGMEISIPPRDAATGKRPLPRPAPGNKSATDDPVVIKRFTATNTRLVMVPREERKNPKVWDIYELEMAHLTSTSASPFRASMTNPIPEGKIEAKGTFGPWQSDEPGQTPLNGEYTFAADLGTIDGLDGKLSAVGVMEGVLDQIKTRGETRTENFRLTELNGHSLPLTTSYDALVDGTKGDVELTRIDITLGKSRLHAKGVVEGTKGVKGKRIVLNVKSKAVDLGEFLRLVSNDGTPPAEGTIVLDTAFDLPQGKAKVLDRLTLEGSIAADRLKFADPVVQEKIDTLSRRAQGRPDDQAIDEVASRVASKFSLNQGMLTYHGLTFDVEGASVRLNGSHALRSRALNLNGEVLLNASASQTIGGVKGWLLKPFNPLFRKNGAGTRLVISVGGTQEKPQVKLDFGKTLRGNQPRRRSPGGLSATADRRQRDQRPGA